MNNNIRVTVTPDEMNTSEPKPHFQRPYIGGDRASLNAEIKRLESLLLTRTRFDNWSVSTVDAACRSSAESELSVHGPVGE